jgi:hypothetical protein
MNKKVKKYIKMMQGFSKDEILVFRESVVIPYLTKNCSLYEKMDLLNTYKKSGTKSIFIELFHKIKNFSEEELDSFNTNHVLKSLQVSDKFPEELIELKDNIQKYLNESKKSSESFDIPGKKFNYKLLLTKHDVKLTSLDNNKIIDTVEWKLNLNTVFKNHKKSDETSLMKLLFILSNLDKFVTRNSLIGQ